MTVREAGAEDLGAWVALRAALWPECRPDAQRREAQDVLGSPDQVCFLAFDEHDAAVGFVEGAIHTSDAGLYGHVEGWYVVPQARGLGRGRELMGALEQWCLHRAISRLVSDTSPEYPASPAAHERAGFRTAARLTIFVKELGCGDRE